MTTKGPISIKAWKTLAHQSTIRRIVMITMETKSWMKDLAHQAIQWIQLGIPIIFIDSCRREGEHVRSE